MNVGTVSSSAATTTARSKRPGPWPVVWPWLYWALWGAWLAGSDLRNDGVQPAVLAFVPALFGAGAGAALALSRRAARSSG